MRADFGIVMCRLGAERTIFRAVAGLGADEDAGEAVAAAGDFPGEGNQVGTFRLFESLERQRLFETYGLLIDKQLLGNDIED